MTGLELDFDKYVAVRSVDGSGINIIGEAPYTTTIDLINSGSVDFVDGVITEINLDADVTLSYEVTGVGSLPYSGSFTISNGNEFGLDVDDTVPNVPTPFGSFDFRYVWDVTGTVAVPEPGSALLMGFVALGLVRRRRPSTDSSVE